MNQSGYFGRMGSSYFGDDYAGNMMHVLYNGSWYLWDSTLPYGGTEEYEGPTEGYVRNDVDTGNPWRYFRVWGAKQF
ncbi:MAG: hypothetical protein C4521_02820 [Actinobacteria bacterium]|nr:MAG: hypothetical protein C4521_02820 [Actinomycetota bacterium]